MLKHSSYFEGGVQSVGFERNGLKATVGVVDTGEFEFGTGVAERMTVISGELLAKLPGKTEFQSFAAGTYFEVASHVKFVVKAAAPAAYLCEFLG